MTVGAKHKTFINLALYSFYCITGVSKITDCAILLRWIEMVKIKARRMIFGAV